MSGNVDWPTLIFIVGSIVVSGGIILSMVRWIYTDSNNTRSEIARISVGLHESLGKVREDMAKQYVSLDTQANVMRTIEKSLDELKAENRRAVDALGERLDAALARLARIGP